MASLLAIEVLVMMVCVAAYMLLNVGRRSKDLPPGPPTAPIIGNLHQIPKKGSHLQFTKWAKEFGGIFSLKMGPANVVVISDRQLVKQLIDKKSSSYSNRPQSYVAHDLMTKGDHLLVMQYGEKWRLFRKLIHQEFHEAKVEKEHLSLQNAEAVQMLRDICESPKDLMLAPKRFSNSIIMSVLFGIRSSTPKASHMNELYEMMEEWSKLMEPGATPPVDILPILKYVPESLFGNWITRSKGVGTEMDRLYGRMVDRVQKRRDASGSRGSFLDKVLDQQDKLQLNRNETNFLVGVMMEGGSDTTSSIVLAFMHAMLAFPHVQKKAHEEIDKVLGEDRTPQWSDYAQLPYVAQIVKETMRWRPVTPTAFPHATSQDDTVNGYLIPKGTTVILNVWGLHHDEQQSPPPQEFAPERFDGRLLLAPEYANRPDAQERDHYGYGSGRRICPGIHLAERNLFLAISKLLWAFEFKEIEGKPVDWHHESGYSEGFLHCPKPFDCDVKPRSDARKETILREFGEARETIFSQYEE